MKRTHFSLVVLASIGVMMAAPAMAKVVDDPVTMAIQAPVSVAFNEMATSVGNPSSGLILAASYSGHAMSDKLSSYTVTNLARTDRSVIRIDSDALPADDDDFAPMSATLDSATASPMMIGAALVFGAVDRMAVNATDLPAT